MWKTHRETIDVANGLRALFAVSVATLLAELKPHLVGDEPLATGIGPFDGLTREQQIVAVCEVGTSLLTSNGPLVEPAAYREATLLALLDCVERNIRREILVNDMALRTLVLASHKELYGEIDHGIPRHSTDFDQWKAFIDCIRKKMSSEFRLEVSGKLFDLPGELSAKYRTVYGIPENYHLDSPDDPPFIRVMVLAKEMFDRCNMCLVEYVTGLRDILQTDLVEKFRSWQTRK